MDDIFNNWISTLDDVMPSKTGNNFKSNFSWFVEDQSWAVIELLSNYISMVLDLKPELLGTLKGLMFIL